MEGPPTLEDVRREMDRLKAHIEAVYDQAAVLSQVLFHMEQEKRERPSSNDSVFVENIHRQDTETLKEQFRLTYGQRLVDFVLFPSGRSARVRFVDEDSQRLCLRDAASWNRDFRIKIHPYIENWKNNKRQRPE